MNKKATRKDPYAAREARKYERPIHSRELILDYLERRKAVLSLEQIARELELTEEPDLEALRRRLNAMERDGQLVRNRRGHYGIASKMNVVRGRVIGHPDGYGFLVPDDGSDDLFLSAKQMRSVLHGDRVTAKIVGVDRRGRREGALVEVLERNTHEVVGRFYQEGAISFVVPSNKRISQEILIYPDQRGGAEPGQIVVAVVLEQPTRRAQPQGKIVEVLGDHMAPGMEIEIAIRSYEIPDRWPTPVNEEIEAFQTEVQPEAKKGREDLRGLPLVTIDGEDAKDFDDAVYCERQGRGWRLLVAIADVSAYVAPGTALDQEAHNRGNSVYFPEHVVPMLPELLSNHLCSLRPEVDRLCMVCEMFITPAGHLQRHRFFDGVMRSHARLTYNEVAAVLVDQDRGLTKKHQALVPHLENLYALYKVLRKAREKRGAIDFDSTETRIVFGEQRKIERIVPVERNDAHRLIEECMITANVAAAGFLLERRLPVVFRTHPGPDSEKLDDVRMFLREVGLRLGGGEQPRAKDYARLLAEVKDRPDRHLIETVLLRSLAQAMYSPENIGHFGLALDAYAHFTSPIRRYPDLLVHRAIRHALAAGGADDFVYSGSDMQSLGDHCSMTERRADEATRDAVDWLKCEYMMTEVGKEFDGIITGVTSFGLFVELDDIFVQGLVHVTTLGNDYYQFDPIKHLLYGERTGVIFRLADKVRVKVARVDLDERNIDFVPAEPEGPRGVAKKGRRKTRSPRKKTAQTRQKKRGKK